MRHSSVRSMPVTFPEDDGSVNYCYFSYSLYHALFAVIKVYENIFHANGSCSTLLTACNRNDISLCI